MLIENNASQFQLQEWQQQNTLKYFNLTVLDSLIAIQGRDTLRASRRVTFSAKEADTTYFASSVLQRDTTAKTTKTISQPPFAAQSNKGGGAWLCPHIRLIKCIFFFTFFLIFLFLLKKYLFLRRK